MSYVGGDQVILFGGDSGTGVLNDTWLYDLSDNTWTQKNPSNSPSARYSHTLAFIGENKVIMFGGNGPNGDETWLYDLTDNTWTQKNPSTKPAARNDPSLVYIGSDQILLFGGVGLLVYDETWLYDLSDNMWYQKNPLNKPPARYRSGMANIGGDRVLVFGGFKDPLRYYDTWIYDLSDDNWVQDLNTESPSARQSLTLSETSMDGSSYLVLFGGDDGSYKDDTWTFGGGDYALPVGLSSFTAVSGDGKVILKWTTQSEKDNVGFIIERFIGNDDSFEEIASYMNYTELKGKINSNTLTNYTFTDYTVINGITYYYKLIDVDLNGNHNKHQIVNATPNTNAIDIEKKEPISSQFHLYQNYPNPFNPETTIEFEIPLNSTKVDEVNLAIYNAIGEKVRDLFTGNLSGGVYTVKWDGKDTKGIIQPSGIYIIRLSTNYLAVAKKMILMR
jgi:hypothetical protein